MSLTLAIKKGAFSNAKRRSTAHTKPFYLPGLNGIRAIAILIIIAAHTDEFSYLFHKHAAGIIGKGAAVQAVTLFFVLSGYLITYLLILEKEKFRKIHYRKFYMRRALRIWPVYFLMVSIAYIIHMYGGITPEYKVMTTYFLYYLFFIPNIFFAAGGILHPITPLWSIGVEEQFYAFWPFVINKAKNIVGVMLAIIGIYFCTKVALQYAHLTTIFKIVNVTRIDSMAIGGIGAYLVLEKHRLLSIIYHRITQMVCWAILIYSLIFGAIHIFSIADSEIYSVLFLIFILNVSTNPRTIISTENKVLNFLGKISYGLFAYHMSVLFLLAYLFRNTAFNVNNTAFVIGLYILTLMVSIPVAYFSYEFFEKRFLNLKQKYAKVNSSANNESTGLNIQEA
ncbi:MAG: acyltransferase [Bacteroidetes bacterium]|nr:acyltransferase [Bacteroidota bacterium]